MPYVLGVDAGASKTYALVIDERGRARGFGKGGTGNHQVRGLEFALCEIERATRGALAGSSLSPDEIELGCFCLAGADLPEDYAMLGEAVERLGLARSILIKNDTFAALRAGLTRPWGVVVICGTGFNAGGKARDGSEFVLPGLGPTSGDWGGGGALAQEMVRLIMREWDGRGKPTLLTPLVLGELGLPSAEVLLAKLYREELSHRRLLAIVPLLFEAAVRGDEVARELIVQLGTECGVTANALLRRLGLANESVEVVLAGSVFKGRGTLLPDTIAEVVHRQSPAAEIVRPKLEPVVGSALLALDSLGVVVDAGSYERLRTTLPNELLIAEAQSRLEDE